jgi:L-malate glycosyltransferase
LQKIVFITPFFGNTGSEIALFNLIVRIKNIEVIVISKSQGSLATLLPAHIKFYDYRTFCKRNKKLILLIQLRNRIFKSQISIFEYFLDRVTRSHKTLFYVNTLVFPEAIKYLKKRKYKFIVHAHELQHKFNHLTISNFDDIINGADFIFTSSKTVNDVFKTMGRDENIACSYPGIDLKTITPVANSSNLREHCKIAADAFVVVMSGTIDVNKNPEAFIQIGRILKDKGLNIHLLWIGVQSDSAYFQFLQNKTKEYNLETRCSWIKKLTGTEYYDYLNLADCFILTSTQESFSIVLVESLALGKPLFSFKSGGPEEIINNDAIGLIIEDHSQVKMAEAIEKLINRQISFRPEMAKARAINFSIESSFENWNTILRERYFKGIT